MSGDSKDQPDYSSGVMVALYPPDNVVRALEDIAGDNGLDPMTFHVTLAYLGDMTEMSEDQLNTLLDMVRGFASGQEPFTGSIIGFGTFTTPDHGVCWYASPDIVGLSEFRADLANALRQGRFPIRDDHGYIPHISLRYLAGDEEPPSTVLDTPINGTWERVSVVYGDEIWDFELGGELATEEDKAGGVDRNRGNAERLRRYWTVGPGAAKIRWRTPGDFTRCTRQLREHLGPRAEGYCALRHREMNGFWPGDRRNKGFDLSLDDLGLTIMESTTPSEDKDAAMDVEYKNVGVCGVKVLDANQGIVSTIVSVTGVVDRVKDIIEPGAYEKTLAVRTPKGVWSHQWDTPVSRTLEVKELRPGDPQLPAALPNGDPWPEKAGGVLVKTQFNLETQRGREAYSDVVFFGDQQEWSIGYQVPVGGANVDTKTGVRRIGTLDWFEYSPVLFGAMPAARTQSVKEAQLALKMLMKDAVEDEEEDEEEEEYVEEEAAEEASADEEAEEEVVEEEEEDEEDEEKGWLPDDQDYGTKGLSARSTELVRRAVDALQDLLSGGDEGAPSEDTMEEKPRYIDKGEHGINTKSLETWVTDNMPDNDALLDMAKSLDQALADQDETAVEEHANQIFDMLETEMPDADEETADQFQDLAMMVVQAIEEGEAPEEGEEEEGLEEEVAEGLDEELTEEDDDEEGKKAQVPDEFKDIEEFLNNARSLL